MQKLSEAGIIDRIGRGECFECQAEDNSFLLRIDEYVPFVCATLHGGHQLRKELGSICRLSDSDRLYEEDPFTPELIDSMPITLTALDSRYEYDLNRPLAQCIYTKAWGREVWCRPPGVSQRQRSINKHRLIYRVLDALIARLEALFGASLIFDIHSYNYKRIERVTPTFNIGTSQIDMDRWEPVVSRFRRQLSATSLPNEAVTAALNDVFLGKGYLIAHINSRFENSLVLPVEVKKVFMDELSGEPFPLVLSFLKEGMKHCISDTAAYFSRRFTRKKRARRLDMLSSQLDPAVSAVDRQLYRLAKGIETLAFINPINLQQEMKRFFSRRCDYQPQFAYRQLNIDPYQLREKLYRLPVDDIRDAGIQRFYQRVIDSISDKIDLLVSTGSSQFVYNSLRYYGEPSLQDIDNARFLLYAPELESEPELDISDGELTEFFKARALEWRLNCKVETSSRIVAKAMVNNSRKKLVIRRGARLTATELDALAHHELGVHMATTINAGLQPLKVFSLGLPGNTLTQEGLAILNEYQSGNLTVSRLKVLALRVVAVQQMLERGDFRHTYRFLVDEHGQSADDAFRLATRVHRGGGFTKDYLYLRGLSEALVLSQQADISNLYIGKTGFDFLPLIDELTDRGILPRPLHLPVHLQAPVASTPVIDYLLQAIRTSGGNSPAAEKDRPPQARSNLCVVAGRRAVPQQLAQSHQRFS